VEIDKNVSLLDIIGIKQKIEDILERRMDLVEYGTIKPIIKDAILQ
jgi:predicted nucleotidyltransferase